MKPLETGQPRWGCILSGSEMCLKSVISPNPKLHFVCTRILRAPNFSFLCSQPTQIVVLILKVNLLDQWWSSRLLTISHFSDEEALPKPHQEADERLHGVLPHRAEEDCGAQPRYPQRRDLQAAWQKVSVLFSQHVTNIDSNIVEVLIKCQDLREP